MNRNPLFLLIVLCSWTLAGAAWGQDDLYWIAPPGDGTAAKSADALFPVDVTPPAPEMDRAKILTEGMTRDELRALIAELVEEQQPPVAPPPVDAPSSSGMQQLWDEFQAKLDVKKYPTAELHGAFQADAGWFHQDEANLEDYRRIEDGAGFRRFRISANGSLMEDVNYFAQVDFGAFGRPTFTDIWVEQKKIPLLGTVRVGQWKQPFSLEVVSSYRYTTFMERSVLFQPFTAFRHIGVGFYNNSENLKATWAASVFRSGQDQYGNSISTDGGWGTAERFTLLPYWENEGQDYLHLGVAHFFNAPPHDAIAFRTIPEIFIGQNVALAGGSSGNPVPSNLIDGTPFFLNTGRLAVNYYNVLGTELLWVRGPFSLQSEAMVNFLSQADGPNVALPGFYVQAGYFLTGEHRPFDRKTAAIDRIIPHTNVRFGKQTRDAGIGAWEIAARLSYIDLDHKDLRTVDNPSRAGSMTDFTAGLNWYLNPYTKMVFNYVHALPDTVDFGKSQMDAFAIRTQIDF